MSWNMSNDPNPKSAISRDSSWILFSSIPVMSTIIVFIIFFYLVKIVIVWGYPAANFYLRVDRSRSSFRFFSCEK